MTYVKNNNINKTKEFMTEKKRNIADDSIIKFSKNAPITDELIKYIECNRKFDNKTFIKYLEVFDI